MKVKGQRKGIVPFDKEEQEKERMAAKALKTKIKAAEQAIKKLHDRYPGKSRVQLLRRIRLELGAFARQLEIARIERNQGNRLSPKDRMFVEEKKRFLQESQSTSNGCLNGS